MRYYWIIKEEKGCSIVITEMNFLIGFASALSVIFHLSKRESSQ